MTDFRSRIKKNEVKQPIVLIFGDYGVGKTSFCLQAPNNIYISLEKGLGANTSNAITNIESYNDFKNILISIRDEKETKEKSLIIDSFTALEKYVEQHIIKDIASKNGGRIPQSLDDGTFGDLNFGKGKTLLASRFNDIMQILTEIKDKKNMRIHIICHSKRQNSKPDPFDPANIVECMPLLEDKTYNCVMRDIDIVAMMDDEKIVKSLTGSDNKIVNEVNKVLRVNDPRCKAKIRDSYLRADLDKFSIYNDLSNLSLKDKNKMYFLLDFMLISELQLMDYSKKEVKKEEIKEEK